MSTYAEDEDVVTVAEDEVPFDVTEDLDIGDLTDQEGGVLPQATRVIGEIRKAAVKRCLENNKYSERPDNQWTFKYLHLEIKIGPQGINDQGDYAGKVLFTSMMDIVLTYNEEACKRKAQAAGKKFNTHWWAKEARFGAKQFFTALNGNAQNIKVNDDALIAMVGRPIMFDIKREKDGSSNRLANWRAVEQNQED